MIYLFNFINGLTQGPETVKRLEQNMEGRFHDISLCNDFLFNYFFSAGKRKRQSKQVGIHQTEKKTAERIYFGQQ